MDFSKLKDKMPWITRVVFLLFIGTFLMILSNSLSNKEEKKDEPAPEVIPMTDTLTTMQKDLANRLESTLGEIAGVGKVTVTVFLSSGPKYNYAVNTSTNERSIDEKDKTGGNRTTSEHNVNDELVLLKEGTASSEKPVLLSEEHPEVQGVLVVADGAADSYIKREMTRLVATLLDIPEYKVTVEPREGGE